MPCIFACTYAAYGLFAGGEYRQIRHLVRLVEAGDKLRKKRLCSGICVRLKQADKLAVGKLAGGGNAAFYFVGMMSVVAYGVYTAGNLAPPPLHAAEALQRVRRRKQRYVQRVRRRKRRRRIVQRVPAARGNGKANAIFRNTEIPFFAALQKGLRTAIKSAGRKHPLALSEKV